MSKKAKAISIFWTLTGVVFLGVWIWYRAGRGELSSLGATLLSLDKRCLAVALALQGAFIFWQTVLYWCLYELQNCSIPLGRLYLLVLISMCAGRLIPAGAAGSILVLVGTAKGEGASGPVTVAVSGLYYLLSYAAFSVFIVFSMAYVEVTPVMVPIGRYPLLILLFLSILCLVAVGFLLGKPDMLEHTVRWISRAINNVSFRLRRRMLVDGETLVKLSSAIASNFAKVWQRPHLMATGILSAFFINFTNSLTLYSVFSSLGERPSLGFVISGFTLGTAISFLTLVPNGMGVYVASLWSVFMLMGVPSTEAGAVSIAYRFVTYWAPAFTGIIAWLIYRSRKPG